MEKVTARSDRRTLRRVRTRQEILDAAWTLAASAGIAGWTMADLGRATGMRAPSLYEYFPSKFAILDAMFAQGYEDHAAAIGPAATQPDFRSGLVAGVQAHLDFCCSNPPRYQLLFQRPVPGFEPSPEAMQASFRSFRLMTDFFALHGVSDPGTIDLWTALIGGLAAQQLSNEPGGDRWVRLVEPAVDMFLAWAAERRA